MIIRQTNYGLEITIFSSPRHSTFDYLVRQVRRLNNDEPKEQELLDELEKREKPKTRKLILLLWSMENFLMSLPVDMAEYWKSHTLSPFDIWEKKNRVNFNEYYHEQARELIEEIDACSLEYCDRSQHGWSY